MNDPRTVFSRIFAKGGWHKDSVSGPGSTLAATAAIRDQLRALFRELGIRSLVDAPCGDGLWIRTITDDLDLYLGFDVVEDLIARNNADGFPLNHFFKAADITRDILPKADAILCRDCLVHLPFEYGMAAVELFRKSGSTYLIATTFPDEQNIEVAEIGKFRPLNLTLPPFNLPPPLRLLRERPGQSGKLSDKSLGVWTISELSAATAAS